MTRLIRIELCDECPYAAGSRSCRASQWCDEGGILRCRKFTDYPLIPDWCPLERDGPDWEPPAKEGRQFLVPASWLMGVAAGLETTTELREIQT